MAVFVAEVALIIISFDVCFTVEMVVVAAEMVVVVVKLFVRRHHLLSSVILFEGV